MKTPLPTIKSYPPVEQGDLRAFARALVAIACRVVREQEQQQPVVQSSPRIQRQER